MCGMKPIATNIADFKTLRRAGSLCMLLAAQGFRYDPATRQFVDGKVEKIQ